MTNININPVPSRSRRAGLAVAAALASLALIPASSQAMTTFGTNVAPDVQPSNAGNGHMCSDSAGLSSGSCTWLENEAYSNGGQIVTTAPKSGTLKKVRWIAQSPGSFRLELAKVKGSDSAKITYRSKKISYQGQADPNANTYTIESAKINTPVKKGQYLAIEARKTSMLRCSSGGPNTLLFQPPLQVGDPFQRSSGDDGCWVLLQGVIK